MATYTPTQAALSLRDQWTSEFGLDPTEEAIIAGVVSRPGATKIGNSLYMRKLKTASVQTLAAGDTGAAITATANTDERVQMTPTFKFAYIEIPEHTLTRVVDDGPYKAGQRKMLLAAINEDRDSALFALATGLSEATGAADLDETLLLDGLGRLAKRAKGKMRTFNGDRSTVYCFIHPDELKNAYKIPAFREYQIRGSAGAAASGSAVSTYGVEFKESGLVYQNAGTTYNILMLPDAFALGHNIEPTLDEPQKYLLQWRFIAKTEYGVTEWFDTSGVALTTT